MPGAVEKTRYVVITPVRDEERYIEQTIAGVCQQTVEPVEWVLVDDGSVDNTGAIIDRYAAAYPFITSAHRPNRGFRDPDLGAVGTFLDGCQVLRAHDWEFIVNLDADVALEPDYFERCFNEFRKDACLGIGGGMLYEHSSTGATIIEPNPESHVRGATKIYRKACWDAIGGLSRVPGWDTLDEITAEMLGWRTRTFSGIKALHQRPTGGAEGGWRDSVKNGRSDYYLAYHPLFMFLKCAKRIVQRPYLVNGLGHLAGFLSGYLRRRPQIGNLSVVGYLRRQQMRRLLLSGRRK